MSSNDNNKNFVNRRTPIPYSRHGDPGPYLARVVSHLDNKFMGALKVQLIKTMTSGDQRDEDTNLITAFYASPFFGVTSYFGLGQNDSYQNTQQSYGFWAVPPDVDTKVLVTFVEGRRDICFWFACVPDDYMNFMVPDGRPSTILTTPGSRPSGSEGKKLPVGEYNKRLIDPQGNNQPTTYVKPVNQDFVNALTEQGLLEDDFRGLTTSSARREVPSAVFGINTPGPLDKRPGAPIAPRGPETKKANVYWSRLGGHSIVMDDGDDKILRKGSPSDSPPEYVSVETEGVGPEGSETRPANELFRIRTRTGHQILLHNTEDLIYIANARGTAWIELTSNGKIDIYAQDSISLHTEGEFNVTADANINLTAGQDINLNATGDIRSTAKNVDTTAGARVAFKSADEFTAISGDFIALKSSNDFGVTSASGLVNITGKSGVQVNSPSDIALISDGAAVRIAAGTNFDANASTQITLGAPQIHDTSDKRYINGDTVDIMAWSNMYITGQATLDLYTTALKLEGSGSIDVKSDGTITTSSESLKFKSGGAFEVGSSNLSVNSSSLEHTGIGKFGSSLYANKVWAPTAELNFIISNSGSSGASATTPTYSLHDPGDAAEATPAAEAYPPSVPSKSNAPEPSTPETAPFAPRVPQHEPWFQHENLNPALYSNIRADNESVDTYIYPTPDPFTLFSASFSGDITQQNPYPNYNSGDGFDEEEDLYNGDINFNEYTDNAKAVIEFFVANGFEVWHGAGIAGALQIESGSTIEPGAYLATNDRSEGLVNIEGNYGYGARGICQWRNAGDRLTNVEKFLGKSLLQQPVTDPNTPGYDRLRTERFPTQGYRSMPFSEGNVSVKVAPANTTLEEQLRVILWEFDTTETKSKRLILAVNSGSPVQRAREVAGIFHDEFLRSDNRTISGTSVKERRKDAAQEVYEAYVSGRPTGPITDPDDFPAAGLIDGTDPAANSRPRDGSDPIDLSSGSNAGNIIKIQVAGTRQNPVNPALLSVLNRAARDSGIHRILVTSAANEPVRRVNLSENVPISNWGTYPSRVDGPGADMRGSGNSWRKLNRSNNEYEFRSNGRSWRTGTERHDTGLAVDCRLQVRRGDRYYTLLPTNQSDRNKIIEFLVAFSRYGGCGVGVGSSGSSQMPNGVFHLDMLGGNIRDASRYVPVSGLSSSNIIGWNRRPSAWGYGGASFSWALSALNTGFRSGGEYV